MTPTNTNTETAAVHLQDPEPASIDQAAAAINELNHETEAEQPAPTGQGGRQWGNRSNYNNQQNRGVPPKVLHEFKDSLPFRLRLSEPTERQRNAISNRMVSMVLYAIFEPNGPRQEGKPETNEVASIAMLYIHDEKDNKGNRLPLTANTVGSNLITRATMDMLLAAVSKKLGRDYWAERAAREARQRENVNQTIS